MAEDWANRHIQIHEAWNNQVFLYKGPQVAKHTGDFWLEYD
jgi:hypothetical protein